MNYRHAFHAGNHADVIKHATLALVLNALKAKDKPFEVLDTHAGRGVYDLDCAEAARSGERKGGVDRVFDDAAAPAALAPYRDAIAAANPFGGLRWYPGSPAIVAAALRKGDSAKFVEAHAEERAALEAALAGAGGVKIFAMDGYQAVRAFLPPKSRRGLALIDPPFEQPGEYRRLAEALREGLRRFAGGIYMIWRPVKDEHGYRAFLTVLEELAPPKALRADLHIRAAEEGRLTGSGLVIVNPPFGLFDSLAQILPYLASRLATGPGAGWSLVAREDGAQRSLAG